MKYEEFVKMDELGAGHWWYSARRKLLKHRLKKISRGLKNMKILDLASACGDNFSVCSPYGRTFGVDISLHAIRYCMKKNITTIVQGDVQHLPFRTNSFDVVLALDVFEHLKDDVSSLEEITRVLKDKGGLIFNVPACMALYSYHDQAFEHVRRYDLKEIRKKIGLAKLKIDFISYWSFFIFPAVFIFRRILNKRKHAEAPLSDFYLTVNPLVELFLKLFSIFEVFLIGMNISLPFGVSLFGIAEKEN